MPKSLLSLVLIFSLSTFSLVISQGVVPLRNSDIVTMVRAKVPTAVIIEKINNSSCAFDTFPPVLDELRYKGVPEEILAMTNAPHGRPKAQSESVTPVPSKKIDQNISPDGDSSRTAINLTPKPEPTNPQSSSENQRPSSPSIATSPRIPKQVKEIKIHGYITEFNSPTSFEIEDYRITRDESVILELENQNSDVSFKKEDLRIGTLVEIRGLYDETTSELRATKVKIDLDQFRQLDVTTILDRKPLELQQTESGWRGLIAADGRRVRIEPETKMLFSLNHAERKQSKEQDKGEREQKNRERKPDDKDWWKMSKSRGDGSWPGETGNKPAEEEFVPLKSLSDVGPGTTMTYHGREQADGTVLATKVEFKQNEMEKAEFNLWKQIKIKETPFNFFEEKPGELRVGSDKYKLFPNQEVQDYVNRLGQSLVPAYQRAMPESNPQKIHFQFRVVDDQSFNAGCYPMGLIVVHSDVFNVLENEAQLAAVLSHEIAHATQEHQFREAQHDKKRRTALAIGSIFAAGMGYYSISRVLNTVRIAMEQGYTRTMENQADRLSLEYMSDAGYDIREAPRVWKLVAMTKGYGPTYYWSSHDNAPERRSFMMVTIRNSFSSMDMSTLKKNEDSFQRIAKLVRGSGGKTKQKVKVLS